MFSDGFWTNSESLLENTWNPWQFLADCKRISLSNLTVTKRGCFFLLLTCLGFGPPAEDRYICGVWVPMAVWDWERSWMFHWPGGSRGRVRSAGKTDSWMFKILGLGQASLLWVCCFSIKQCSASEKSRSTDQPFQKSHNPENGWHHWFQGASSRWSSCLWTCLGQFS